MTGPPQAPRLDLVCLTADVSMKSALMGVLSRASDLKIRPVTFQTFAHPDRDPGCLRRSHEFIAAQRRRFEHVIVVFDRQGCGREHKAAGDLEEEVEGNLARRGWEGCSAAICIDPELEVWVWSSAAQVSQALGWERGEDLTAWLTAKSLWQPGAAKPDDPKKAMLATLKATRTPMSADIYGWLAQTVDFRPCRDRAFRKLCTTLRAWFPQRAALRPGGSGTFAVHAPS